MESDTKMFWQNIFNENNINTPKLIGIINNKKIKILSSEYKKNNKYIIKPNKGFGGEGICFETVNTFVNENSLNQLYLVQERVYDCTIKNNYPRHYRLITYLDEGNASLFMLIEYKLEKSNILKSNFEWLSIKNNCNLDGCKHFNKTEKKYMEIAMKKLTKLHEQKLKSIVIIGWDIMLACDNYYVLEGNYGPTLCYKTNFECEHEFEKFNNIYIKFFNKLKHNGKIKN